jgi:AraC-like DNA-binding protein
VAERQTEWVVRSPAPVLADFVDRYVGYRLTGFPSGVHRGLPSRHMTLNVSIGHGIEIVGPTDPTQAPATYRSVVGGLQASPTLIAHGGETEGVAIELTPVGSRALLGMPARSLWNTTVELDALVGPAGTELWERLQRVDTWESRFEACDRLLSRLLGDDRVEPALARAWRLLVATAGAVPVANLAQAVGWTRQHLTVRFVDEFGLAPKLAARVVRLERARRMMEARLSLAQVASSCGYYDQAHLTRDFVDLAGCPPGRLLADDLPSVQDGAPDDPRT